MSRGHGALQSFILKELREDDESTTTGMLIFNWTDGEN
jgi:hypothetical protein